MYYQVKLHYRQPKPHTDEMQKVTKQYLVYAESVTEAELRTNNWVPSNFQDAVVEEVKQTKIDNLYTKGASETYWQAKFIDEGDGKGKPLSFLVVLNGYNIEEAIKTLNSDYSFSEIEEVKKFKVIIDEDLVKTELTEKPVIKIIS